MSNTQTASNHQNFSVNQRKKLIKNTIAGYKQDIEGIKEMSDTQFKLVVLIDYFENEFGISISNVKLLKNRKKFKQELIRQFKKQMIYKVVLKIKKFEENLRLLLIEDFINKNKY